ncbi:MAG: VPLPA-CTERM sorting domain-containing protein [Gammaproteobacteria bacterium]
MKMKKTAVILGSMCMLAGAQMAQAALYDVTGVFNEPMLTDNTIFIGTFDWDAATNTLSGLQGTMNASMYGPDQIYSLTNQLAFDYNKTTGVVIASVFKENSTDVFFGGGYATGDTLKLGALGGLDGFLPNENVYFTLAFNAFTMVENKDGMVYGDCSATGLMGPMMTGDLCMTGHSLGGTMGATPLDLIITPSAVPVPAAVWLFGSGLLGLVGVARRKAA